MDVWVYVVLKSKIPNLASTIAFLRRYSNPNLAFSEAGYYLASVEFACQYLVRINEQDYRDKTHLLTERIVVCEQARFGKMAREEAAVFEIVSQDKWLQGFEVFAVKEWHLDPTRWETFTLVDSHYFYFFQFTSLWVSKIIQQCICFTSLCDRLKMGATLSTNEMLNLKHSRFCRWRFRGL